MHEPAPSRLQLPTPGCYADPDRSGLMADDVFDGMAEHLFYTLGKLAPTASRHEASKRSTPPPPAWWPTSRLNS